MPEVAAANSVSTSQTLIMWAVAAILLIWQVVLTFALLRSREEERDEVANIGRMAFAFSQMLDRLEHMQASIPSLNSRWGEGYGPPCTCPAHGSHEPPAPYHDGYGPRDHRDDHGWGRHASGYGRPVALDDPPRRRR